MRDFIFGGKVHWTLTTTAINSHSHLSPISLPQEPQMLTQMDLQQWSQSKLHIINYTFFSSLEIFCYHFHDLLILAGGWSESEVMMEIDAVVGNKSPLFSLITLID